MKCVWLLFLLSALVGRAETFIGYTTQSNRLLIQTNEAIFITTLNGNVEDDFAFSVILRGQTNQVFVPVSPREPYAVAGPAELVNSSNAFSESVVLMTFHRVTNSTIQSLFLTEQTNSIFVASNRTLRLLPAMGDFMLTVSRGTQTVSWEPDGRTALEFSGPLTLHFSTPPEQTTLLSYYFLENGFTLPGARAGAGPLGTFEIAVEKSLDLTNWSPVILHQATDSQRSFYRMRLSP